MPEVARAVSHGCCAMPFEILSEVADAGRWAAEIMALPRALRDIHYLPDYGRIYRDVRGFTPLLALYSSNEGCVVQPIVRRPLHALPFLAGASDAGAFSDIANAYGYGGPLSNATDAITARALYAQFAVCFATWCEEQGIASEFASLHPLMTDHQRMLIGDTLALRHEKDVVIIELGGSEAEIEKRLRKGHHSSILLARRAGVRVERVEPSDANIALFSAVYHETMLRRQAEKRWFFPEKFFTETIRNLGPHRSSLFFASVDGQLESACLLIHEFATAYYHFAATRATRPQLGVNNLIVWEAAMWAKAAGYSVLHLGGGVTSNHDDSLLRFKAGFSSRRAPLYTYFTVRDRAGYDVLCERKRSHERATTGAESTSDFVPLYRR